MMEFSTLMGTQHLDEVDKDETVSSLEKLSKAELEKLLSDQETIRKLARNSPEVKKIIADREACMQENRRQAETNLSLEPLLSVAKTELMEAHSKYQEMESKYLKLKSDIESFGSKYSADAILALLQAANAEAEEKSEELADQFLSKSMDVDSFLKDFIPLRKLCNERRIKSEKLAEQISSNRSLITTQQTIQHMPYRFGGPSTTTSVNTASTHAGGLYPSLKSLVNTNFPHRDHSPYGFNL